MIRRPTSPFKATAWWRGMVENGQAPFHIYDDEPQCGFYARRYVRGGPLVPVRVFLRQDIDPETGELMNPEEIVAEELGWEKDPSRFWTYLKPISREEYDALVEQHRTDTRMAATHAPINLHETPTRPSL